MISPKLLESLSKEDSSKLMLTMIDVICEQTLKLNDKNNDRSLAQSYIYFILKIKKLYKKYNMDPPKSANPDKIPLTPEGERKMYTFDELFTMMKNYINGVYGYRDNKTMLELFEELGGED